MLLTLLKLHKAGDVAELMEHVLTQHSFLAGGKICRRRGAGWTGRILKVFGGWKLQNLEFKDVLCSPLYNPRKDHVGGRKIRSPTPSSERVGS